MADLGDPLRILEVIPTELPWPLVPQPNHPHEPEPALEPEPAITTWDDMAEALIAFRVARATYERAERIRQHGSLSVIAGGGEGDYPRTESRHVDRPRVEPVRPPLVLVPGGAQ